MLQGSLDNFTLDEVLSLLATTNKTGRLAISGDRGTGSLWLDDGSVVGADASNLDDLTAVNDVMFELLRFETGSFLFTMNECLDAPGVAEDIDALLDGAQGRITEWRTIEAVVPSLNHELWLTRSLGEDEIVLSRSDWEIVVAVGEGNTVGSVCTEVELGEVDGSREIKGLIQRGILTISEQPAEVAAPAPTFEAPVSEVFETAAFETVAVETVAVERVAVETVAFETVAVETVAVEPLVAEAPVPEPAPAPSASFGASLAGESHNAPSPAPDPSEGLHDLFADDEPAPVFEPAPIFEPAPVFEPGAFEAPQPLDAAPPAVPDAGRPPMPPPPTIGSDGSIQAPTAPLIGAVEESDDEASLLMRYLKTDSH